MRWWEIILVLAAIPMVLPAAAEGVRDAVEAVRRDRSPEPEPVPAKVWLVMERTYENDEPVAAFTDEAIAERVSNVLHEAQDRDGPGYTVSEVAVNPTAMWGE